MSKSKYDENLNREFLEAMCITITEYQPWQFALAHPNIEGRFMWYPHTGSLIYESPTHGVSKVGVFTDSEDVYEKMMKYETT